MALNKTRVFEDYGIYISIFFVRGAAVPQWRFEIKSINDCLISVESNSFSDYDECIKEAIREAVQYI